MPACRNRDERGKVVNLVLFTEKMQANAFSFSRGQIEEVAALVLIAARARNAWRVIREAIRTFPSGVPASPVTGEQ